MVNRNSAPTPAQLHRVALENLGNFRGDAEVAEDLGIATTPESFQRRVEGAHEVTRVLHQSGTVAELDLPPATTTLYPHNPKFGFDKQAWATQPPEQQVINQAGIAAAHAALSHPKGQ